MVDGVEPLVGISLGSEKWEPEAADLGDHAVLPEQIVKQEGPPLT